MGINDYGVPKLTIWVLPHSRQLLNLEGKHDGSIVGMRALLGLGRERKETWHFLNIILLNLEGICDAPTDGNRDHEEAKASNQDPKPMNQELKDVTLLFGSPRADRGAGCLPTGV